MHDTPFRAAVAPALSALENQHTGGEIEGGGRFYALRFRPRGHSARVDYGNG